MTWNVTFVWWYALCGVAVMNVALWVASHRHYLRAREVEPERYAGRGAHLHLSAIYVLGCGLRSTLPRVDVSGVCMLDTWLSNVLVGRSVATLAELCFAAQWMLLVREVARWQRDTTSLRVSYAILPLIGLAQAASWYAVLTTNYLAHAVEQSIWTFTTAMVMPVVYRASLRSQGEQRRFFHSWISAGVVFLAFMCLVDVPMYLARWRVDEALGRPYEPIAVGLARIAASCNVQHAWTEWRDEIAWMTLYFTVAVWTSVALVHAPRSSPRDHSERAIKAREPSLSQRWRSDRIA